jgi:hypothetical protein
MGVSPSPSLNGRDHRKKTRGGGRFPSSFGGGASSLWGCSGVGKGFYEAAGLGEPPRVVSLARGGAPE